jgi:hypothetical protein
MLLTGDLTVTKAGTFNSTTVDEDFNVYGNDSTQVLHVDAANLRVGINNASPAVALDLTGASYLNGAVTANGSTADVDFIVWADSKTNKLTWDAGTSSLDIVGDADISGTTDADTVSAVTLSGGSCDFTGVTNADTLLAEGPVTINANTADVDVTIYGNDKTALTTFNAGTLSVDIGFDADVAGTLDTDTLTNSVSADFTGTLTADTVTAVGIAASNSIDCQGTLTADTLTVAGDADFAASLTADTVTAVNLSGASIEVTGTLNAGSVIVGNSLLLGSTAIARTADQINAVYYHDGQPGVGTIDFTGVCSDGETVTIGSRIYEFDDVDGASCTGSEDVCIDVSGGASAAQCGTALVAGVNGDASRSADTVLNTDIVSTLGVAVNDAYTLTETGTNISVSSANAVSAEAAGSHSLYHCDHTVTATEQTALGGATGAITVCGVASTTLPNLVQCDVVDSSGQAVTISNTSFNITQHNSNYYGVIVKDTGGGNDIDSSDRVQCLIIVHN